MTYGTVEVTNPRMVDERCTIKEFNSENPSFSVQTFLITGDAGPLGKHAHARKTEIFVITRGGGYALIAKVDASGNLIGEIQFRPLVVGHVLRVEPYEAHTFYLAVETEMICVSSEAFDEKNQDFIPCPWLMEEGGAA